MKASTTRVCCIVVIGAVVVVALYLKGDVRAVAKLWSGEFSLEVKERTK
jgi:hypothetical protein